MVSNQERIKAPSFPVQPKTWYRIESRVDVPPGSGVVRAKAWKRMNRSRRTGPSKCRTTRAPHGAAGVYGFALQNQFPVYIDNISVTPNQ